MTATSSNFQAHMGEGQTPLIRSIQLGPQAGFSGLWFKLENCNPTGSYKDRFAAAEVTRIVRGSYRACAATSSGNTGSALAAYSARYGIRCTIFVNEQTPSGKLMQMRSYGARIIRVRGFGEDPALSRDICDDLERLSRAHDVPLVISAFRYCPEGMRGVCSLSRELLDQCTEAPIDHVFVPVGGGGLYSAVCEGLLGNGGKMPKVHVIQPEGSSTVAASFQAGRSEIEPVVSTTRISGLSVPFDIDGTLALGYLKRCGGTALTVTDDEVFAAQARLLRQEGVYSEPAGATAYAGFVKAAARGIVHPREVSICLVTGHGSKDPKAVEDAARLNPEEMMEPDQIGSAFR